MCPTNQKLWLTRDWVAYLRAKESSVSKGRSKVVHYFHYIKELLVFTGLIEELGTLVDRKQEGTSVRLQIEAQKVLSDLKIDDSISVNGCCQTVVRVGPSVFEVIAVRETLLKTTLGSLTIGAALNLERAATLETRLGGHLVQGHVDGRASVREVRELDGSWEYFFEIPEDLMKFIVSVGSY
jgi:riboflavin synthase